MAAALALALTVPIEIGPAPAFAADYPTWEDVQAARANESSKQAEIARIKSLIEGLEQQVAEAQALAQQRGAEYEAATIALDEAAYKADQLASAAQLALEEADRSNRQAGLLASQLARTGGSQLQMSIFAGGEDSEQLLYQLGAMSKLTEKTGAIYAQATQDRNTAQSLTDQADVAKALREELRVAAEAALQAAIAAQAALEESLKEQQEQSIVLAAQLDVLTKERETTEAEYQAGVEQRRREREAAEAAERERRAREGGGGGGGGDWVVGPGGQGWTDPLPGHRVSDEWGNRFHPIDRVWRLHAGIDLVKAGGGTCGATVYAAGSGRVTYAGYNGGLGNAVEIDHGGGRRTVYGHNTTVLVRSGWEVGVGQPIAYAGTTGASTGCHVHFETRVNGTSQNPRQFLGQYGVGL